MGSESPPTTSFDLIEDHKENIQPLSSGRSARALANSLSPLLSTPHTVRSTHYAIQSEFEQKLESAPELDDPLEVWLEYVNWTIETFPSGNSTDSGLLSLLERVTKEFLHHSHYKNDPRYLKLWIQYARDFSDAPREIFAYLARHEIGQNLALFYEEYAALLESLGRKSQAAETFQSGIENNARPVERLHRKFEEFCHRLELNSTDTKPSSPAIPVFRPALAMKQVRVATSGYDTAESIPPPPPQPSQQSRSGKPKMIIFSDSDQKLPDKSTAVLDAAGWESIGSLNHRKKENNTQARTWTGETLKQDGSQKSVGDRLMVFRDGNPKLSKNQPILSKPKPNECIAINLDLVYPEEEEEEFSFEELRAIKRGLYGVDWNMQRDSEFVTKYAHQDSKSIFEDSRTPVKIKTVLSPSMHKEKMKRRNRGLASPTMTFHTKAATDEIYSLFNQPLKASEQPQNFPSDQSDSHNESDDDFTSISHNPQLTASHHYEDISNTEGNDADSIHSDWSDFALKSEVPREEKGPIVDQLDSTIQYLDEISVFEDDNRESPSIRSRKMHIPPPPEDFDPPKLPYHVAKDQFQMQNRLPYMTPIVEKTESLPPTTLRGRALHAAKTPSRSRTVASLDENGMFDCSFSQQSSYSRPSSPPSHLDGISFLDASLNQLPTEPIIQDIVCNPLDLSLRTTVFGKLNPSLNLYPGYYSHPHMSSARASEIKKFSKSLSKRDADKVLSNFPRMPLLDFITGDGGSSYEVRKELGKGAFAPVYLVQNLMVADAEDDSLEDVPVIDRKKLDGRKRWEALKMEDPPTAWEFYIMRQAQQRLAATRSAQSLLLVHELHIFSDEGFLILEYLSQGTILDLVNLSRLETTNISGMVIDEPLAMFITVELLRTVEDLHLCGIIHGDLKPDNCLVRFESLPDNEWTSRYQPDGSGGWSKKGVCFIDFGRGIDMTLFTPAVQFVADWKTDQQDCAEMREMRPWTYQVDYHGLASIIHSMLFGRYIETLVECSSSVGGATKQYKIAGHFKRYWQQDIWMETFDMLLNPLRHTGKEENGTMPITNCLRECRARMEDWLVLNADKGVGLKNIIRKIENLLNSKSK